MGRGRVQGWHLDGGFEKSTGCSWGNEPSTTQGTLESGHYLAPHLVSQW